MISTINQFPDLRIRLFQQKLVEYFENSFIYLVGFVIVLVLAAKSHALSEHPLHFAGYLADLHNETKVFV